MSASHIRIDDLARPRLSPLLEGMIASAAPPERLTAQAVLDAASAATGLTDFGDREFVARLDLWCASVDADTGLNQWGRASLFNDFIRLAINRLKVEDMIRRHPEILDIEIERPIIIAGLPRSGTTHLVNILSADPRLNSMPLWESMQPVPEGTPPADRSQDPRFLQTRQFWGAFEEALPHMRAMHEMAPDHTHEEIELQKIDFASYELEWLSRPHAWREYYLTHDQTPHYAYGKKVLQLLTWLRGPRRWVLKSPQHMEQLGPLKAVFPDATLVITHRDPLAVIQSAVTMIAYGDRLRRRDTDPPATARYWIDRIETLLRRCVRDRALWPADRSLDVYFDRYMADQDATLDRIAALAGLERTPEARAAIDAYVASHPRAMHGKVVYDLAGDFDVDIAALRERFAFYFDAFPVAEEKL